MATPESIKAAARIVLKEKDAVVVVSAPGKRDADDIKVTDMLFCVYDYRLKNGRCDAAFKPIEERFLTLAKGIGVTGLKPYLDQIRHDINAGASLCYTISRGEYISALLMRHLAGCEFIDAARLIKFDAYGKLDYPASFSAIDQRLKGGAGAVIPGFYGSMPSGEIKTFARGGSDVTGAVIAAGLNAEVYENWTDVDGVYFCPLIDLCNPVAELTYKEMRSLAYTGATVLHPDSLPPCEKKDIPILIKNTFNPSADGTIVHNCVPKYDNTPVIAFSGRTGFCALTFFGEGICLKEFVADSEKQGGRVFTALGGTDSYTLILDGQIPDTLRFAPVRQDKLALFTIIGKFTPIIKALSYLNLNGKMLQADEHCVFFGVQEEELNSAMKALCGAFLSLPML